MSERVSAIYCVQILFIEFFFLYKTLKMNLFHLHVSGEKGDDGYRTMKCTNCDGYGLLADQKSDSMSIQLCNKCLCMLCVISAVRR